MRKVSALGSGAGWNPARKERTLHGMSSFHFYRWNQFKVIPLACTLRTRNLPKFSATSNAGCIFANVQCFGIGL